MKFRKSFITVILCCLLLISGALFPHAVSAEEDNETLVTKMEEARQTIEETEEAIASGSMGFFLWHDPESPAAAILQDRIDNQYKDSWGHVKLGADGDATSLDNMYQAILFIGEGNGLRAADGNGETHALLISDELMAVAQIQTTNSARIMAHSRMYGVTENLAWGYSDPFSVWYYEEKALYFQGVRGWDVSHFLNMINPGGIYSRRIHTGFAVVTRGTIYGATCGQTFGTAVNYPNAKLYTYDEYLSDFLEYRDGLYERLEEAKKTYEECLSQLQPGLLALENREEGILVSFEKIPGVDSYILMRGEDTVFEDVAELSGEDLLYLDHDVKDSYGTTYRYTLRAVYEDKESGYGIGSVIERLREPEITEFRKTSRTSVSISFAESDAEGHEVFYSMDGGETWECFDTDYPFALLTGLKKDTEIQYRIRAYTVLQNGEKNYSDFCEFTKKQ